jgi:hypothetical protein
LPLIPRFSTRHYPATGGIPEGGRKADRPPEGDL